MRVGIDLRVLSADASAVGQDLVLSIRRQLREVLRAGRNRYILFCREDLDLAALRSDLAGGSGVSIVWLAPPGPDSGRPEDVLRATEAFQCALDAQELDVFHVTAPDLPGDLVPFTLDDPLVVNQPPFPLTAARARRLVRRSDRWVVLADHPSEEDLGRATLAAYEEAAQAGRAPSGKPLRLALWTPVPPQESGIADYSVELLRQLVRRAEVEVFVDDGVLPGPEAADLAPVRIFTAFERRHRRRPFDVSLFQLGASYSHLYMEEALRRQSGPPAIVTLHDLTWGALLYREAALWGEEEAFRRTLAVSDGEEAVAEHAALGKGDPATLPARMEDFLNRHLLLGGVVAASRAQIVHLPRATTELAERYPASRVFDFPMGVEDPRQSLPSSGENDPRQRLGLPADAFLIGTFGVADPVKRLSAAVEALARLAAEVPEADPVLLIVGGFYDPGYRASLEERAAELGCAGRVRILGRTATRDFDLALLACDAVVNLRYPFRHQMSATLMRAIAAGKPVVVSDVPSWDHFPASFCLRVAPGPGEAGETEVEALTGHLRDLARDPARRRAMGEAARRFWEELATPARMAEGYLRVISEVLGREIERTGNASDTADIADTENVEDAETMSERAPSGSRTPDNPADPVPSVPSLPNPEAPSVEPSPVADADAPAGNRAALERFFERWDSLRARSAVQEAGGLGQRLGFAARTAERIRNLGISWDLQRDLFRALIDHQIGLEEANAALRSRLLSDEGHISRLQAMEAEVRLLRQAEAELRGAINEMRSLEETLSASIDEIRARGGAWDRSEMVNLRDRQESLRVRQARLEGDLADLRLHSAGVPPTIPLTPLEFAEILAALERDAPAGERAGDVEVSIQDLRSESLLLAARRHFGGRLSSAGYRGSNDLWIHVDFTAHWNRPLLLENASSRLMPGGRFLLITATAAGAPPQHPALTLQEDREVPVPGGGPVRVIAWRRA